MIPILIMAGAMAGEKANMDTMSRIESNSNGGNNSGGKRCPKCGSEMEPFFIAGGASMTVGGGKVGPITNFGSEEGHECTNCNYEEMD